MVTSVIRDNDAIIRNNDVVTPVIRNNGGNFRKCMHSRPLETCFDRRIWMVSVDTISSGFSEHFPGSTLNEVLLEAS